ncbi:MAG: alpha/beta fold hydrolase [Anditalea sp.]
MFKYIKFLLLALLIVFFKSYQIKAQTEEEIRKNYLQELILLQEQPSSYDSFDSRLNSLFEDILSKGVAILAMDLIGYGTRIEAGTYFYERYPHWSKLGKMVTDTRAAVDALEDVEFIDKDKIYAAGYSLGGTVSLFTAALEPRIAGVGVASAFTPLRTASDHVEGLKAYSHLYGLIPRLGFFKENENRIPVDFKEILSTIAPRPMLVIAPELDRHADHDQVKQSVEEAQVIYNSLDAPKNLQFRTLHEFNHFTDAQQEELVKWLDGIAGQ